MWLISKHDKFAMQCAYFTYELTENFILFKHSFTSNTGVYTLIGLCAGVFVVCVCVCRGGGGGGIGIQ